MPRSSQDDSGRSEAGCLPRKWPSSFNPGEDRISNSFDQSWAGRCILVASNVVSAQGTAVLDGREEKARQGGAIISTTGIAAMSGE